MSDGNNHENRGSAEGFTVDFLEKSGAFFYDIGHPALGRCISGPHDTFEECRRAATAFVRGALREMWRMKGLARCGERAAFSTGAPAAAQPWTRPTVTTIADACRWCGNERPGDLTLGLTSARQPCMICREGHGCRVAPKGGVQ